MRFLNDLLNSIFSHQLDIKLLYHGKKYDDFISRRKQFYYKNLAFHMF